MSLTVDGEPQLPSNLADTFGLPATFACTSASLQQLRGGGHCAYYVLRREVGKQLASDERPESPCSVLKQVPGGRGGGRPVQRPDVLCVCLCWCSCSALPPPRWRRGPASSLVPFPRQLPSSATLASLMSTSNSETDVSCNSSLAGSLIIADEPLPHGELPTAADALEQVLASLPSTRVSEQAGPGGGGACTFAGMGAGCALDAAAGVASTPCPAPAGLRRVWCRAPGEQ